MFCGISYKCRTLVPIRLFSLSNFIFVIQVAPEEVERVIGSVPGVYESVVCLSEKGPVAAVVLEPQATVTREQIKNTVAGKPYSLFP